MFSSEFIDFYCRFNLFCIFDSDDAHDAETAVYIDEERVAMGIPSIFD